MTTVVRMRGSMRLAKGKYLLENVLKTYEPPEITELAPVTQERAETVLQKDAEGPLHRV